jgi:hypothetical protein
VKLKAQHKSARNIGKTTRFKTHPQEHRASVHWACGCIYDLSRKKDEDEIYGCNQARERRQKCGSRERYGYETIREISMLTVLYHEHVGRMKELE